MEDGNVPFDVMLRQAVQLKEAQMQPLRRAFDSWPSFYKHSMFAKEDILRGRTLPFEERLALALSRKERGNSLYAEGAAEEAVLSYEEALSLFRFVENTQEDWKHKSIEDSLLRQAEYGCATAEESSAVRALYLSCYLNLSLCYLAQRRFSEAVQACDAALNEDAESAKALYRRAQARTLPASSGATELDMALRDIEAALRLAPNDACIRSEYVRLKEEQRSQAQKDQQLFGGLFRRKRTALYSAEDQQARYKQPSVSVREAREIIQDLSSCAERYEREGRLQEARILAHKAAEARAALEQHLTERRQQRGRARSSSTKLWPLNLEQPSSESIEQAAAFGVDLSDPKARRLMDEIQRNAKGREPITDETVSAAEARLRLQDTTKVVLELVRPLHRRDALQLLHELGEEHQPAEQVAVQSPDMLQAHVAHKVAEALLAGRESAIKYLEHAALRSSRRRSRHISIAFAAAAAALWLIWRLWLYGYLWPTPIVTAQAHNVPRDVLFEEL